MLTVNLRGAFGFFNKLGKPPCLDGALGTGVPLALLLARPVVVTASCGLAEEGMSGLYDTFSTVGCYEFYLKSCGIVD